MTDTDKPIPDHWREALRELTEALEALEAAKRGETTKAKEWLDKIVDNGEE